MTQEVVPQVAQTDPLTSLIAEIANERLRIGGMRVDGALAPLRNELAETVMPMLEEGLRHLQQHVHQLYAVAGAHAEQLDEIDARLGAASVLLREDAEKIARVVNAFIALAQLALTTIDADGKASLEEHIVLANEVLELIAASVVDDDDDDDEDGADGGEDDAEEEGKA